MSDRSIDEQIALSSGVHIDSFRQLLARVQKLEQEQAGMYGAEQGPALVKALVEHTRIEERKAIGERFRELFDARSQTFDVSIGALERGERP